MRLLRQHSIKLDAFWNWDSEFWLCERKQWYKRPQNKENIRSILVINYFRTFGNVNFRKWPWSLHSVPSDIFRRWLLTFQYIPSRIHTIHNLKYEKNHPWVGNIVRCQARLKFYIFKCKKWHSRGHISIEVKSHDGTYFILYFTRI